MQPLNRHRPDASVTLMQNDTMQSRPEIAVLIAECIAVWAEVEFNLGHTLALILGADWQTGLAMYFALTGSASQRAALDAAATVKMTPAEKEVFDAVMIVVTKAGRQRNRLVHWCWGTSPQLPADLLLVDPEYKVRHLAGFFDPGTPGFDRKHAYVVRQQDVRDILAELIQARDLAGRISGYMWSRNSRQERDQYLAALRNEPPVQAALAAASKPEAIPMSAVAVCGVLTGQLRLSLIGCAN